MNNKKIILFFIIGFIIVSSSVLLVLNFTNNTQNGPEHNNTQNNEEPKRDAEDNNKDTNEQNNELNIEVKKIPVAKKEINQMLTDILNDKENYEVSDELKNMLIKAQENGDKISFELNTAPISESEAKQKIADLNISLENNESIGQYYDINFDVNINDEKKGNITVLKDELQITVDIPKKLLLSQDDIERNFNIIRIHNGIAEKLDTIMNNDGTITFKTNKFSIYILTYTDRVKENKTNIEINSTENNDSNTILEKQIKIQSKDDDINIQENIVENIENKNIDLNKDNISTNNQSIQQENISTQENVNQDNNVIKENEEKIQEQIETKEEPKEEVNVQEVIEKVKKEDEDVNKNSNEIIEEEELIPSVPSIISLHTSDSNITINFIPTTNTNNYMCYTEYSNGIITKLIDGNLQCNINDLNEGTNFNITIKAINKTKENSIELSARTDFITPGQAEFLSYDSNDKQIFANFSVSNNTRNYICLYKEISQENYLNSSATIIDDTVYCELNNLKEYSDYSLVLKSINGDKETLSNENIIKTKYKTPNKPTIKEIVKELHKITIKTNIPDNSTDIFGSYGTNKESLNNEMSVLKTNNEYIFELNDLSSNTKYFAQITSTYNNLTFNSLDNLEIITNDYENPGKPVLTKVVSNVDNIEILFSVVDNATEYKIYFGEDKNNLTPYKIENINDGIKYIFNNLKPSTEYFYKLEAINGTKNNTSEIYSIYTSDLVPEKPKFEDYEKTSNSIKAKFKVSKNAKKYICYFGTNEGSINFLGNTKDTDDYVYCNLDSLTQNTKYYLKLRAINNNEYTESEITELMTDYEKPTIPVINSNKWERKTDSLKISYSKAENATSYTCYYGKDKNSLTNSVVGVLNGNEVNCDIKGLTEGTTYYVKLFVTNNFQTFNESEISSFKTNYSDPKKPILDKINSTSNSIVANYIINRDDMMYVCYYGTDENNLNNNIKANIVNGYAQCNITKLEEHTQYYLKLTVVNVEKTSISDTVSIRTKYKMPNKPVLKEKLATNNSLSLKFNIDNDKYKYICKYGSSSDSITNIANSKINGNTLECDINNLLEKKTYYIAITVQNGDVTNTSEILQISTTYKQPGKPTLVSLDKSPTSVRATFFKTTNATNYTCYYGINNNLNNVAKTAVDDNEILCEINNLTQGTSYGIKVIASNNNEVFTESDIVNYTTPYEQPKIPIVEATDSTQSSVSVSYNISGYSTGLECYYGTDKNNINTPAILTKNSNNKATCSQTNLRPQTDYYVKMVNINGDKKINGTVNLVKTKSDASKTKPYLEKSEVLYDKIRTVYTMNGASIKGGQGKCYIGTDPNNLQVGGQYLNTECKFTGLKHSTTYYVKIEEILSDGQSAFSDVASFTTDGFKIGMTPVISQKEIYSKYVWTRWNNVKYPDENKMLDGTEGHATCYAGLDKNNMNIKGTTAHVDGQHATDCYFLNLENDKTYYIRLRVETVDDVKEGWTTIKTEKANNPIKKSQLRDNNGRDATIYINSPSGAYIWSNEDNRASSIAGKILNVELYYIFPHIESTENVDVGSAGGITDFQIANNVSGGKNLAIRVYRSGIGTTYRNYYLDSKGNRITY